jgi:hypothetical protein
MACCCCVSLNVYCVTVSSSSRVMEVISVSIHSASEHVVRYTLAIFKLISRCPRTYFWLLCSHFIASIHTGAPYVSNGGLAPLYIVAIDSFFSPHDSFAALVRLCIIFVHISATYVMCSWNLNIWSEIIS